MAQICALFIFSTKYIVFLKLFCNNKIKSQLCNYCFYLVYACLSFELISLSGSPDCPAKVSLSSQFVSGQSGRASQCQGNYFQVWIERITGTLWDGSLQLAIQKCPTWPLANLQLVPGHHLTGVVRTTVEKTDLKVHDKSDHVRGI